MISGLVLLYNRFDDELVQRAYYKDRKKRNDIIKGWKQQYGEVGFNKCYIQISPNVQEDLVSIHTGINIRKDNLTGQRIRMFKYKKSYEKYIKSNPPMRAELIGFKRAS